MSAMPIALLLTTAATAAVGVAVLRTLLGLRGQVAALRNELAENRQPAPRAVSCPQPARPRTPTRYAPR